MSDETQAEIDDAAEAANPYATPLSSSQQSDVPLDPLSLTGRPTHTYLAIWLVCSVLAFGIERYFIRTYLGDEFSNPISQMTVSQWLWSIGRALVTGLATAAPILMLACWCRSLVFPSDPGEWLLVSAGVFDWLSWAYQGVCLALPVETTFEVWRFSHATDVVPIAILAGGGFRIRESRVWAVTLLAAAVYSSVQMIRRIVSWGHLSSNFDEPVSELALDVAFYQSALVGTVVAVAFFAAITLDIRRKVNRSWIHWIAVAHVVALALLGAFFPSPGQIIELIW